MNTEKPITPPPLSGEERIDNFKPTFMSTLEALLRKPGAILYHLEQTDSKKILTYLFVSTVLSLLLFGFVVGMFSWGAQLWAAPLKIIVGFLFAGLICTPSFFVFSHLSGLNVKISTLAALLIGMECLASLLLVGFAPVVWVFSQSTEVVGFIGSLNLIIWLIALFSGFGFILKSARLLGAKQFGHLKVWMFVFLLVVFQVSTSLRPIIGSSDKQFTSEKKFFLEHWSDTINEDSADATPAPTKPRVIYSR